MIVMLVIKWSLSYSIFSCPERLPLLLFHPLTASMVEPSEWKKHFSPGVRRRRKPGLQDLLPANRATIGKCKVHQSCRRGSSNLIFQEVRFNYLITFGPQFDNYIPPFGPIGQNCFGLSNEHSYQYLQISQT